MNTKRNRIAGVAAVLLFAAVAFIIISRTKSTAAATVPPPPDVEVAKVQQRDCLLYTSDAADE